MSENSHGEPSHLSEILYDERGMTHSFEERDVAGASHNQLVTTLDQTAGELGELHEARQEGDPYLTFSWKSPAGDVEYGMPADPTDVDNPRKIRVVNPTRDLLAQLMRVDVSRWMPLSEVKFTIERPDMTHEGDESQVMAETTSRLFGVQKSDRMTYLDLSTALQGSGVTPRPAVQGRTSTGH